MQKEDLAVECCREMEVERMGTVLPSDHQKSFVQVMGRWGVKGGSQPRIQEEEEDASC